MIQSPIPGLHKRQERGSQPVTLEKPCVLPQAKSGINVNRMLRICWGNLNPGSDKILLLWAGEQLQGLALEKVWA